MTPQRPVIIWISGVVLVASVALTSWFWVRSQAETAQRLELERRLAVEGQQRIEAELELSRAGRLSSSGAMTPANQVRRSLPLSPPKPLPDAEATSSFRRSVSGSNVDSNRTDMKLNSIVATGAAWAGIAIAASAGEITGKITLAGTPPPEPQLEAKTQMLQADLYCGKQSQGPKNRVFQVGAGGELGQVVVRLVEGMPANAPVSSEPVVLDQKNCEYVPYVTAVQTGQKLLVRNSDEALHNVNVAPKIDGNKASNKAQMAKAADIEYNFPNAEDFLPLKCDVHRWMFAYVIVQPHPFFAVSGADGSFTIKNLPDGKYKVEAIHRRGGKVVKDVEVKDGKAQVNFELTAPAPK